jgi:DNA-binding HxlR family transcriptional regulator
MSPSKQNPDLDSLISLVHHRWSIPIIALLYSRSGAKFITLASQLGASRTAMSVSLRHLIALGLVERNTGHGHPMRPEYLLSERGLAIGKDCVALTRAVRSKDDADLAFRKWTLPLVAAIGEHSLRFNELRSILVDATPRAITLGLKSLLRERWAERTLIDEYPPAAGYELRPKGQRVLSCVHGLY